MGECTEIVGLFSCSTMDCFLVLVRVELCLLNFELNFVYVKIRSSDSA